MIKTGISLYYPLVTPELIRLLKKHPDVEICWIEGQKNSCDEYTQDFFETLQEEAADIPVLTGADVPDLNEIDLYIGRTTFFDAHKPDNTEGPKAILTNGVGSVIGVCEFSRKSMVRGAREVWIPDLPVIIGAIALMPLAKNLLLNSPIEGTMLIPVDRLCTRSSFAVPNRDMASQSIGTLRDEVLTKLQSSFNSPIEISVIESTVSSFSCGIFNTGVKLPADQSLSLFKEFYGDHRHIYFPDDSISERMVIGTNKTAITLRNDSLGRLIVNVGCDALYKGAAGNIVHILNLLFGLDERTAL